MNSSELAITCMYGVPASHDGTTSRRADGRHVVLVQDYATVGKRVNVGC